MTLLGCVVLLTACDGATTIFGTTKLGDTRDRLGPYTVVTEVSDPDGVDRVLLRYQPGAAGEVSVSMSRVTDGVYEGEIPGQPPFTTVRYFVLAEDSGEQVTDPPDALSSPDRRYQFQVLSSTCAADLECGTGEFCDASGSCRQHLGPCSSDADCGKGMRCGADGACRLAVRSCVLDEGCLVGEVCDTNLGECAPRPGCGADASCPLDFICDKTDQLCRRACVGAADCGPGEACTAGACSGAKSCAQDSDCGAALVCDPAGGFCRPKGAGPCASCLLDADCGGPTDFCLLLGQGQYCGQDCSSAPCPSGYSCSQNTSPPQCVPDSGSCP